MPIPTFYECFLPESTIIAVHRRVRPVPDIAYRGLRRAAGGLPALSMDSNLSAIASSRCESFVAGGPFDHSGMVTLSEICAAGPLGSASAACAAWQASETHYANIMRTDISSMGVGCWFCEVDGNRYTYLTVTFG